MTSKIVYNIDFKHTEHLSKAVPNIIQAIIESEGYIHPTSAYWVMSWDPTEVWWPADYYLI